MTIDYDAEGDLLRIQFGPTTETSRLSEVGDGVLIEVDRNSKVVTGVEIWNLAARAARCECVDVQGISAQANRTLEPQVRVAG